MRISIALDMTQLTFKEWICFVFDHPMTDPAWYWSPDWEYVAGNHIILVQYLTRLFRHTELWQTAYSPEQLEQGLWFILGPGGFMSLGLSEYTGLLREKNISWFLRKECIESMASLFENLFATDPLGGVCFMWWDLLNYGHFKRNNLPQDYDAVQVRDAMFKTVCRILTLDARACQKSALHGLGHLHHPEAEKVIDAFLQAHPHIDQELKMYALECRAGIMR